jgi:hypothetical protein
MTSAPERSTFVTVVAWTSIVLSGFGTAIAALQNAMIYVLFPRAQMQAALESDPTSTQMPAIARFFFANIELVFAVFLLLGLVALASSIGLLHRKNWARVVFIGVLACGIAWNLGGLAFQGMFMSQFSSMPNAPQDFERQFQTMQRVMLVVGAVFAVGFSGLFGWIIWRLKSAAVVREFSPTAVA